MTGMFFKKINESVVHHCGTMLIIVGVLVSYLILLLKTGFFLENGMIPWLKTNFYYWHWEIVLAPWIALIAVIAAYFAASAYFKKESFLNFLFKIIVILFIGATLYLAWGIIFHSSEQGRIAFSLISGY